jgi:hypothetical protein
MLIRDQTYDDTVQALDNNENPSELEELLMRNWSSIRTSVYRRTYQDILNCRLYQLDGEEPLPQPSDLLPRVWREYGHSTKINVSFGFILRHTVSGRLRYFHSSSNNATVFQVAQMISNNTSLTELIRKVEAYDIASNALAQRPNTSWNVHSITNCTFYIYKLPHVARIGCPEIELPTFITHSKSILSMKRHTSSGLVFDDRLCFFRCLAMFRSSTDLYCGKTNVPFLFLSATSAATQSKPIDCEFSPEEMV